MNDKKNMKDTAVEYYEKVGLGNFVKTIIVVLALVFGVVGLVGWYSVSLIFAVVMSLPILFIVSFLYVIFGSLTITITSKELVVAFRFFNRKKFFLSDIESCEQATTNGRTYHGVGMRYGVDGSLVYSTSFGSAVRITKAGEKPFVFSTNNPETVCQILSTKNR
ncbi:MAG: hypothetical protein FWH37_09640 [Candidatus Bathyarchaeota archaeon]|nr:hypothetical protein [Candidatus Termiticorpusculum sp.]